MPTLTLTEAELTLILAALEQTINDLDAAAEAADEAHQEAMRRQDNAAARAAENLAAHYYRESTRLEHLFDAASSTASHKTTQRRA